MTDRELLELAAKATGDFYTHPDNKIPDGLPVIFYLDGKQWNPLTDDGDAMRLAVKLGMDICVDTRQIVDEMESHNNDLRAFARRAIVRAAAEIGKTL